MRLIRIHVAAPLGPGASVALSGAAAGHARRVLRLGPGDAVTLFNGDGADYPSRIRAFADDAVEVDVLGTAPPSAPESPVAISLVQGIARAERMDLIVQKATELGVAAIQPVVTARSVVRLDASSGGRKQAHWQAVAISACEQCGRARTPRLAAPVPLPAWLDQSAGGGLRLLLAADAVMALTDAARNARAAELLVGPEGGLDDSEREAAKRAGYLPCRLGPRILRSETAAIAAIAVLQSVAGDLG